MLICLFRTATYYSCDIPSTLQEQIMVNMNVNSAQYGIIFMILTLPSVFTAFATGIIVDRIGVQKILMPIMLIASLGMVIQTVAAYMSSFNLLLLGRFVFALGYEPINVAKGMLVNDWFLGAELSTANSINLSFVRGIVFLSGTFTPVI